MAGSERETSSIKAVVTPVQADSDVVLSEATEPDDRDELLLRFLRDRDVECPQCQYNLRTVTRPVCPECGTALELSVGEKRIRVTWLLLAVAPGFFSGFAGLFLLIPIIGASLYGAPGSVPWPMLLLDGFGLFSGATAIAICIKSQQFCQLEIRHQRELAVGIWLAHVVAFIVLVVGILAS